MGHGVVDVSDLFVSNPRTRNWDTRRHQSSLSAWARFSPYAISAWYQPVPGIRCVTCPYPRMKSRVHRRMQRRTDRRPCLLLRCEGPLSKSMPSRLDFGQIGQYEPTVTTAWEAP